MSLARTVLVCSLIYATVNLLIVAIGFRVSDSYDYWIIGQKPVSTTGLISQRQCNHKGNCWIDYEFPVGDQRFSKRQTDAEQIYRAGVPVAVVYRDDAPKFSVAGSLGAKQARAFLELSLLAALFTPIPAIVLIWLYLATVAPSEARQWFLTGYRFVDGRHTFAYAPIWGLLSFSIAIGWGGGFALITGGYVLLGLANPEGNVMPAFIACLCIVGLFSALGANCLRAKVEVSTNQVRVRSLLGSSEFSIGEIGRTVLESGRNARLLVFARDGRTLLIASDSLDGFSILARLLAPKT